MSGDVQPRKRKDKKKKKDDLGAEEDRGTAAALGEGDVFMHSYHDHGTGGHWCAKIIFFSLLAVLVTLIGLIILENRGLTELEANSVESRYSGVLEGWIEDAVDDHHDEHTLELKHHDDDEDHPDEQLDENDAEEESLEEEIDHNDDDDEESKEENDEIEDEDDTHDDDNDDEEEDSQNDEEDDIQNDEVDDNDDSQYDEDGDSEEDEIQNDDEIQTHNDIEDLDDDSNENDGEYGEEVEENLKDEDEQEEPYEHYHYEKVRESNNNDENDDEDAEGDDEDDDGDMEELKHDYISKEMTSHYNYQSYEDNGEDESKETKDESIEPNAEDEASEEDDQEDNDEQEIEKIEKEIDGDNSEEIADDRAPASKEKRESSKEDVKEEASNEDDEPPIEKISRPQTGKPFIEIEEEPEVKPVDTLADEEAYERQQEELRRQEEEAPHSLWLKLLVGGALLAATHALVRRHTRPDAPETEDAEDETPPLTDRRMTIVDEPIRVAQPSQATRQIVDEEVFKRPAPVQSAPIAKPIEEEIVKEVVAKVLDLKSDAKKEEEKELYSEEEEDEEDVEEDNELPLKEPAKKQEAEESEPEPEEVSDVEIIYDETVEEEEVPDEEVDEEEISDVDDAELLSRLEAKYGRLPEPERPGQYKGGGNSLEAEWPGEPSDPYWRSQLDTAEEEFRQGAWSAAAARAGGAALAASGRARWLRAAALDRAADHHRDNRLLADAVAAYLHLLDIHEALGDRRLLEAARRAVDRIQFRGAYMRAEPVYRLLIRRFPDVVDYRNNLTVLFLMANRADLADEVLRETLLLWPNDRVALAHHGFVLKTHYNKLEEAVLALRKALDGDAGAANEPRFYYHLGDALLTLGRFDEAHEVHKRGAKLGHFLSPSQRSLYNVPRLRGRPWWRIEDTPYVDLVKALEASWRDILKEGEAAVALYEQEKEGLKERGEWSQLDIFVRGREVGGRCERAPAVCRALRGAGRGKGEGQVCRRGQVKFSMMTPGTHVRPHVGPTNCRLRMHLALSNTEGTYIRVDKEIRQWQLGKTFIFDDSFEHEVWHNGTGTRLVLIVDVWHPDLTAAERRQLPAI